MFWPVVAGVRRWSDFLNRPEGSEACCSETKAPDQSGGRSISARREERVGVVEWLVILLVVTAVAWLVLQLIQRRPRADMPYRAVASVLTPAERRFAETLERVVGGRYRLLAKVRMADLLEIQARSSDREWWQAFARISQKHADFVLVDPINWSPRLVIELDDRSHRLRERQERDAFVTAVYDAAGLPFLRVPVQRSWDERALSEAIDVRLGSS